MLYDKNPKLEDIVISELVGKRLSVRDIYERVLSQTDGDFSIRAIYKIIKKHTENGVLLKAGKEVFIDSEWLDKIAQNLFPRKSFLPQLGVGESIVYTLNSLSHLDAFWKTIVAQISIDNKDYPIFFYNPHDFWLYIKDRSESEERYYNHFQDDRKFGFFVIGGETKLDKKFKQKYQNEYLQIDLNNISSIKRTDHITILSDYLITVRLPEDVGKEIDLLFEDINEDSKIGATVEKLFLNKRIKFKLERNPKKSQKLRKILSRNFFIPSKLIEEFQLS